MAKKNIADKVRLFKLVANEKRIDIVTQLNDGEKSVAQLLKKIKISRANMSQHLALFRLGGFATTRRDRLNVFYSFTPKGEELVKYLEL